MFCRLCLRLLCLDVSPRTHTTCTHTDMCSYVQSTDSEQGSDLQAAAAEITRFSRKKSDLDAESSPLQA